MDVLVWALATVTVIQAAALAVVAARSIGSQRDLTDKVCALASSHVLPAVVAAREEARPAPRPVSQPSPGLGPEWSVDNARDIHEVPA